MSEPVPFSRRQMKTVSDPVSFSLEVDILQYNRKSVMSLKKCLIFSIVLVITIAFSAVLIVTLNNKQPVYTEAQKKLIETANERLKSLGYHYEDKILVYKEFDAFDKRVDREQLPEYLKSVKTFCVIDYHPKGKYTFGGGADVYIDIETGNILHVDLIK